MFTPPQSHLASAKDAMITFDAGGAISWSNAAAAALFHYPLEAFIGLPMSVLVPERLRHAHAIHHQRYIAQPGPASMGDRPGDLVAQRSDGSEFLAEISLSPTEVDEHLSILAIIRDVTPRREVETDNMAIRLALDSVAEAVFMFDVDSFTLWYANNAALRQVGLESDQLLDFVSFAEISHPTDDVSLEEMLEPLVARDRLIVTYDATHSRSGILSSHVEVLVQRAGLLPFGRESFIALARDTSARQRRERDLAKEAQERNRREAQLVLAEERERIARRLQDSVIQRLFAVGIGLQAADSSPERLSAAANVAVAEIDSCIAEVRDTIFTLEER